MNNFPRRDRFSTFTRSTFTNRMVFPRRANAPLYPAVSEVPHSTLKDVPKHFEAIVIGVGAMGSSACYHLAQRGKRVLGLEQFSIPNDQGSSHGMTRIIRLAYSEHPSYVNLLRRAYELWHDLENVVNEKLLYTTGGIDAGPEDSWVFQGSWLSCKQHDLPHQVLTGAELHRKFPGYNLPSNIMAVFQPDAGFLTPERCVASYAIAAQSLGAEIHGHEPVLGWEPRGDGFRVVTTHDEYHGDKLIISAGAWAANMIPELRGLTVPERQILAWLQPSRPEYFQLHNFPVFQMLVEEGRYYGFPQFGIPGFKFARYHHFEEIIDPDDFEREANEDDESVLREFCERYFPYGVGPTQTLKSCIFTNTPDRHFILDIHPELPNLIIVSPCSGHGFKFVSVIGEIAADLAIYGTTRHDISLFQLARFSDPLYMASLSSRHRAGNAGRPRLDSTRSFIRGYPTPQGTRWQTTQQPPWSAWRNFPSTTVSQAQMSEWGYQIPEDVPTFW
ncbi:MAG TPA: N-methyl-L-tryptophan oxidase [Anaerolineae bacterium]|nr:N-methyl-L-tryptophan oxidase [Anaerolineae bacterium]